MSDLLDVKLVIDKNCPKLTVTVENNERNEDVEEIIAAVKRCANRSMHMVQAYSGETMELLPQRQILRVYISGRKVLLQTLHKTYELKKTLKEAEEALDAERFVRISQSEIINIRKVRKFDFSGLGTIGVELENGEKTWVARRRVKYVKEAIQRGER